MTLHHYCLQFFPALCHLQLSSSLSRRVGYLLLGIPASRKTITPPQKRHGYMAKIRIWWFQPQCCRRRRLLRLVFSKATEPARALNLRNASLCWANSSLSAATQAGQRGPTLLQSVSVSCSVRPSKPEDEFFEVWVKNSHRSWLITESLRGDGAASPVGFVFGCGNGDDLQAAIAQSLVGRKVRLKASQHLQAMDLGCALLWLDHVSFLVLAVLYILVPRCHSLTGHSEACAISGGGKVLEDA
jgi:hypothetical protein